MMHVEQFSLIKIISLGLVFVFLWMVLLLEISQEAEECYGWETVDASFLSRLQTLDRLWDFLGLTALIYENRKDNAVAVIWLSDNFPLGISNNKDIWACDGTSREIIYALISTERLSDFASS